MFRFTIRDVLWLTVVVALGLGWGVERDRASLWKWRFQFASDLLGLHEINLAAHGGRVTVISRAPGHSWWEGNDPVPPKSLK